MATAWSEAILVKPQNGWLRCNKVQQQRDPRGREKKRKKEGKRRTGASVNMFHTQVRRERGRILREKDTEIQKRK